MGNAPPTAEGPDWNLDEIRSLWPQEQWPAQVPPIIAAQLALTQANPPFPVAFPNDPMLALVRSIWPQETWPAQTPPIIAGPVATPAPVVPNPPDQLVPYSLVLPSWPPEFWGTQYAAKIAASISVNPLAPVLRQSAASQGTSVTSLVLAFPSNVTAGSMLVAYTASTVAGTPSVSDNLDGSYNRDVTTGSDGIFTFLPAVGGSTTVTYSFSVSSTLYLIIEEWSGLSSHPLDKTATNSGTGTSGTTGMATALAQDAELVLAMAFVSQAIANGNVTIAGPLGVNDPSSPVGNSSGQLAAGNFVTSSHISVQATFQWTNSVAFQSGIATYKFPTAALYPSPPANVFWTLNASWPREYWYAQSECSIAGGLAHLQQPPLYNPSSIVAAQSNIRATWPLEYWTAQTSGPIGGWYVNPITALPFPVAHNEIGMWPRESWPAQVPPQLAAGFSFGLPPVPYISIGGEMSIRMLWPQESWGAQTQPPIAAIPQITVGFPETPEFINSGWPIYIWPQEQWSAQTGAIVAAQLAPLFVPPVAPIQPPPQVPLVNAWPREIWGTQRASFQVPIFIPQNPSVLIVPNVIGMYVYDAQQALLGAGFRINTPVLANVTESTTLGIVLAQSIPAKTLVPRVNPPQITITVAAYLSELPPQTP